ncbi:MAG: RusA family crossover junction endodeoxyribonuclease [Lachnospiraceae bacterium]|nr:RusA family crossover junction endodeoxyribonuclease [Lachnospiraceae bacterium]
MEADKEEALKQIRFTIPGEPFGKQRPRVVSRGSFSKAYTPKETVSYENLVKLMYQQEAKGKRFPEDAMFDVRIVAYYGIPKSVSKKKQRLMLEHKLRPVKKPDWDNIGKIICDSLNTIAYKDDSAVVDAQVRKFYSETPRVDVLIKVVNSI